MGEKKKKFKIPSMSDRRARISAVRKDIHAEYGDIVGVGTRMKLGDDIRRFTTGSFMMDYTMGGGVPEGRIIMFKGAKSSGKTTHASRIVAQAQGLCRRCMRPANITDVIPVDVNGTPIEDPEKAAYWIAVGECDCIGAKLIEEPAQEKGEKKKDFEDRIAMLRENSYEEFICMWNDMEMVFEWAWARRLGVDERRLLFARPETGEEAIDAIDPLLRSGAIDLMVNDSIAHMIPSVEVQATTYDQQQGAQARLVNKGVRKFVSALAACARKYRRVPTQIWINQLRDKLGPKPSQVAPGGKGQGFATSIELKCWRGKRQVDQISAGNDDEKIDVPQWEQLCWKCEKNKVGPPYIEGHYTQWLTDVEGLKGQIKDEVKQLFRYAAHFELLQKSDKDIYTFTPTGFESKTQKAMREHLNENMDLLKSELMNILLLREM